MTDYKASEFLKLSGAMDLAKLQMQHTFETMDFGELTDEERAKIKNRLLTRFLEQFDVAAMKIVAEKFPATLLDDLITFYKTDTGRQLVFYNMMLGQKLNEEATRLVKETVDELVNEEVQEEKRRKREERKGKQKGK